jgi:hypothetical protein
MLFRLIRRAFEKYDDSQIKNLAQRLPLIDAADRRKLLG